jgi:5-methylcytosine-specific restriction protein A
VAATVVNHRKPHKGNWSLFIDATNHESTCKPCHDGPIQSEERRGFSREVGVDGWPTSPAHPANAGRGGV